MRVQHYENQKLLKALGAADDIKTAMKVTEDISEKLVKQLQPYHEKYEAALIAANVVDGNKASEAEAKGVMKAILMGMQAKRDEQIGHLEALQDLFKEALHCARLPFGVDKDGTPIQAQVVHSVRELADQAFLSELPKYEDLLPLFSDHRFATEEGIKTLREHDRTILIVAENGRYDTPLVLYGAELIEKAEKAGKAEMKVRAFPVESYSELQFTIAAIAKFVGVPSTDGGPWKDL